MGRQKYWGEKKRSNRSRLLAYRFGYATDLTHHFVNGKFAIIRFIKIAVTHLYKRKNLCAYIASKKGT